MNTKTILCKEIENIMVPENHTNKVYMRVKSLTEERMSGTQRNIPMCMFMLENFGIT